MTTTRENRDRLYSRLREVLGPEHANILIAMLPPDIDRLATKADIGRLEKRMDQFEERLWDFHEALRAQTRIYVTTTVSSMFGVAGFAFGAAVLL